MERLIEKLDKKNKLLLMQKREAVGKYQKEVKNVFNLSEILSTIINVNTYINLKSSINHKSFKNP
jgi:hypothetical protein